MKSNGQQQPVAIIQIAMQIGPDGLPIINATYQGPDRNAFNMMIERARQDIIPVLIEKEKQKSVVMPTAEATLALGR